MASHFCDADQSTTTFLTFCATFSLYCEGAPLAVAAMLGKSLYPTMLKRSYDDKLSIGAILAGASLAPIIPPSLLAVVIATLADVSIGEMLIAGVMPGLLAAVLFLAYIFLRVMFNPALAPEVDRNEVAGMGLGRSLVLLAPFSIIVFAITGPHVYSAMRA
ncbi:TRAP transporter large permease subunit [Mesorhizobium sp. KR2-14]|uniref:TRAP transporter large permease subunit n=1 Tax=Mesorhizobium sp. KR2-14 TaxID=3156610 RepID=UPI0032B358F4